MAHELDTTDGVTSFASANLDAWHNLGVTVDGAMDAETAMRESHLAGWNVRKIPVFAHVDGEITETGVTPPMQIEVPGKFATVRTNPVNGNVEPLGVVGPSYTPIQNEENADLLNALVDESGAHFETAGALRGGRETFVTMKLPESMVLDGPGGEDRTDLYIAALNSHDGNSAFRIIVTPVRIVCANTQSAALGAAKSSWSIRHTSGAKSAISEARHSLKLTWKYVAAFEEAAERMIAESVELDEAKRLIESVFALEDADSERKQSVIQEHVNGCVKLMEAPTNEAIAGTRFAVYNSVTEYVDHHWKIRGAGGRTGVRPEMAIRGQFADLKAKSFQLLSV